MKKLLLVLMATILFVGCGNNENNEETKKITKEDRKQNIIMEQEVNNLTFEHFAITEDSEGVSILYFDITNNTKNPIEVGTVTFTLYTQKATVLSEEEFINQIIAPGESVSVVENYDVDLSKVDDVKYQVN